MAEQQWWVYIVETQSGKLYTGITTDTNRRFKEHCGQAGKAKGAKYFRTDPAKEMVYQEQAKDRSEASSREYAIKKLTRRKKLALIAQSNT